MMPLIIERMGLSLALAGSRGISPLGWRCS